MLCVHLISLFLLSKFLQAFDFSNLTDGQYQYTCELSSLTKLDNYLYYKLLSVFHSGSLQLPVSVQHFWCFHLIIFLDEICNESKCIRQC